MSKWSEWKNSLGDSRPWHMLDPNKRVDDPSTAEKRLQICLSCPQLNALTKQCKLCLCYMPAKTSIASAECPEHKWGKES